MLNWNDVADRFYAFYADKKTTELVELFGTNKTSLSKWKSYDEKIPLRVLAEMVAREQVTWDWLLEGRDPQFRR